MSMNRREFVLGVAAGIAAGSKVVGLAQAAQPATTRSSDDGAIARRLHWAPGISTCFSRPNRFEPAKHLPMIAAAGFKCIELNCSAGSADFLWDQVRAVRELVKVSRDTGVEIYSVHGLGEWLPAAGQFERRKYIDLARAFADFAAEIGAGSVAIHAWRPKQLDRTQGLALLRETLAELEAHARPLPCVYGWENEALGLSAAEHLAMLGDLDPKAFGFVFDTGHANIQKDAKAYMEGCGPRLCGLHLNDNDGRDDKHRTPGRGTFAWDGFGGWLRGTGYVGPIMLELEARDRQDDLPAFLADARAAVDRIAG